MTDEFIFVKVILHFDGSLLQAATFSAPTPKSRGVAFAQYSLLTLLFPKRTNLPMQTQSVKLPNVPLEVVAKAKSEAVMKGMSMADYLTELITKVLLKDKK